MKTMSRTFAPASLPISPVRHYRCSCGPHSDAGRGRPRILRRQQCERSLRDGPGQWPQNNGAAKLEVLPTAPRRIAAKLPAQPTAMRRPAARHPAQPTTMRRPVARHPAASDCTIRPLGRALGPKPEKGRIKVQLGTRPLGLNVLALSGLAQPVTKRAPMEDRVLAPAFVLLAAVLAISSPSKASAADPSGIWAKDDGSAKVEIKKCGRGLCGSVVWLRNSEQFARQAPARRQERERVPAWPADHWPSPVQQHASDSTQHLGGECL